MKTEVLNVRNFILVKKEFFKSKYCVLVPESVVNHANENFTQDSNKFLGLLIELGLLIDEGKMYQVFNGKKEKLNIDNFNHYQNSNNTRFINLEFESEYFDNLIGKLDKKVKIQVNNWLGKLFAFSLIAPNMQLEIENEDKFVKLNLPVFFRDSRDNILQFSTKEN